MTHSEWDDDDDVATPAAASHENAARSFIHADTSECAFDIPTYLRDPFPKLVVTEGADGDIYAGNVLHGNSVRLQSGKVVHFASVLTLYSRQECDAVRSLSAAAVTVPKIEAGADCGLAQEHCRPLPTKFDLRDPFQTDAFAKDIVDIALKYMKTCRKPMLVRCINGMSRTVACFTAFLMLERSITFRDAYLEVDRCMGPARIDFQYEQLLVTHVHDAMVQRSCNTFPMEAIRALLQESIKKGVYPFNIDTSRGEVNTREYYLMRIIEKFESRGMPMAQAPTRKPSTVAKRGRPRNPAPATITVDAIAVPVAGRKKARVHKKQDD